MSQSIKNIVISLISKRHSLRTSILTLFISLFAFAFICILSFTYSKNYQAILTLSKTVADETTALIHTKFNAIAMSAERFIRISSTFFLQIDAVDFHNPLLSPYFLSELKTDPNFSNVYIGFPDGNLLTTYKIIPSYNSYFIKDPKKPLPEETRFILRITNKTASPSVDIWKYLDQDFQEIASEIVSPVTFDVIARPWYQGAEETKHLFWTDFYTFVPKFEKGITVSNPIFIDGKIKAIIGADLSLSLLSRFLEAQNVGKSGRVFILNQKGEVLIPSDDPNSLISSNLVQIAYKKFQANPKSPDFIFKHEGNKYLSFITSFPNTFGNEWLIIAVAPLDDFLGSIIHTQNQIILFIIIIIIISILIIVYFAKRISNPIVVLSKEINKITELNLLSKTRVTSNIQEISLLDEAIASMRQVVRSFSKYIPKEIVKNFFDLNQTIALGGEKKELTIFFSDISNFTSISESQPIDNLFPLLTEYFDSMSKIILGMNGTIDKFIGDGIMAFWGAPVDMEDHAQKACEAALICHAMLENFNAKRRKESKPEFPTRFGIHSGMVIVGNIGTEDRLNYTIIGDAVNTTARLQEVDKVYHTSIIISEEVYLKLSEDYVARPLDLVAVKGKTNKTKIYELIGKMHSREDIRPTSSQIDLCNSFTQAYEAMQKGNLEEARELFSSVAKNHPSDFPTQIYLKRIDTDYHK